MIRQVFRFAAAAFFEYREMRPIRVAGTRLLRPFWPTIDADHLARTLIYQCGEASWVQFKGDIDINPSSGDLFCGKRLVTGIMPCARLRSSPLDLTCHFMPRRVPREPSLILYCGDDCSPTGFIVGVAARFFALDSIGLPNDVLLLVSLDMGRTKRFQDCLIDQVFRPRPIEIMRRDKAVHVNALHVVDFPIVANSEVFTALRRRVWEVYGPFVPLSGPAVVLCQSGPQRAKQLLEAAPSLVRKELGDNFVVIDPDYAPMREVVKGLASARCVLAPAGDELSLLALVETNATIHEVKLNRNPSPLAAELQRALADLRR